MEKKNFDQLMRQALVADREPEEERNRNIMQMWEEKQGHDMGWRNFRKGKAAKDGKKRKLSIAAATVAGIFVISVTGGAAVKYLTGRQVAEEINRKRPAEAFESKDAIVINQSKEAAGYRFTLLEIATGETILEEKLFYQKTVEGNETGENIDEKTTYVVLAIEHTDGTPMPDITKGEKEEADFFISPLIQGLKPWAYDVSFLKGYISKVKEGVYYRMIECDDIEIFADRQIYLCITDGFHVRAAYDYDEESGEISRKEGYQGINLLFELPLDKSKADPEAAEEYLKQVEETDDLEDADSSDTEGKEKVSDKEHQKNEGREENGVQVLEARAGSLAEKMTAKLIRKCAKPDPESIQKLKEEKDGRYYYQVDDELAITFKAEDIFEKKKGWSRLVEWFQDGETRSYILCYRDKKGNVTGYQYKEKVREGEYPSI